MKLLITLMATLFIFPVSAYGGGFLDRGGRKIGVKAPFKRIISLYPAHTENLFALGLGPEIIGISRGERVSGSARGKKIFSYREDPEKFLGASPDLVLVRPMIERGYPNLIRRLEKSGITVVSLQPNSVNEMYDYWMNLGTLTGREKEAACMVESFKRAVQECQGVTSSIKNKKRVYFEAIHSKMKTFTGNSMAIFVLEAAGGVNIASDARQVRKSNIAYYGKERIMARAKEIDVFMAQAGTMNRPTVDLIKNEPGFNIIKGVKEGRIFIIKESLVSRPTPGLLTGIYETGKYLYPDLFNEKTKKIFTGIGKGGCH